MVEREIHSAVVTGPTGAIGVALCNVLLAEGIKVYAVTHPGSKRVAVLTTLQGNKDLHIVPCDTTAYAGLPAQITSPVDCWFHLAWAHTIGEGRNDMPAQIANIRYTIDAVRAASALHCQIFIGAGSQAEYGRVDGILHPDTPAFPENGYGMAKLCAGQMSRTECMRLGMAHVWPRILSVYGLHDGSMTMITSTISALLAGEVPALTAGEQQWDYLYSVDAAEALLCMARHGVDGAVYPLGSGTARPLREYIEILRDAIDPALPLGLGEIPYGPLQVMHLQADIDRLQADTGWQARTSFADGIRETIRYIRGINNG